jgi:predicted RNase H-like nuclease (RuvC/YqgF family)
MRKKKQPPKLKAVMVSPENHAAIWKLCGKGDTLDSAISRMIQVVTKNNPLKMYPEVAAILEYCRLARISTKDVFDRLEERDELKQDLQERNKEVKRLKWMLTNVHDRMGEEINWNRENVHVGFKRIWQELDELLEKGK